MNMDAKIKASWQRALHPKTLKTNIITASIFSMAFEMLKDSIVEKLRGFYINGFDESGFIISDDYKHKVLSLNKSTLYASLKWLQNIGAINETDVERFEHIKKCRNTLAHEMLKFTSEELDFEVSEVFSEMVNLLRKIELWWFENLEMATDPDSYPEDFDLEQVVPGPVWSLQMLIDIALGDESEAMKYYEHFMAASAKA